jgi:hypothetical protein
VDAASAAAVSALQAEVWQPVIPNWQQLGEQQCALFLLSSSFISLQAALAAVYILCKISGVC